MIPNKERKEHKLRMRAAPTPAERIFRDRLKAAGFRFRFQVGMGFYIADFLIEDRLLVIEMDGSAHDGRAAKDEQRSEFIRRAGFKVVRIPNAEAATWPLEHIYQFPLKTIRDLRSAFGKIGKLKKKSLAGKIDCRPDPALFQPRVRRGGRLAKPRYANAEERAIRLEERRRARLERNKQVNLQPAASVEKPEDKGRDEQVVRPVVTGPGPMADVASPGVTARP